MLAVVVLALKLQANAANIKTRTNSVKGNNLLVFKVQLLYVNLISILKLLKLPSPAALHGSASSRIFG
jgi:hypothetical protein